MSTIYKFQDSETGLSVTPAASDVYPVYSTVAVGTRKVSATLAAMAPWTVTTATSATTGTNMVAYGVSRITAATSFGYLIDDPLYAGYQKIITVTTTAGPTVTTAGAKILSAGSTGSTIMTFNGAKGARIHLVAISTDTWLHASSTTTAHVALS